MRMKDVQDTAEAFKRIEFLLLACRLSPFQYLAQNAGTP